MDYPIELLAENKKYLERQMYKENMMVTDMKKATGVLQQIDQLKQAIKILKIKSRQQ